MPLDDHPPEGDLQLISGANPLLELVSDSARRLPSNREYIAHLRIEPGPQGLIRLSSNENTLPPSPRVREALASAYETVHLYPSPLHPLRAAVAQDLGVSPDTLLFGAGSTELVDSLFRTFLAPGDELVLPTPSWPVYVRRAQAIGARIVEVPLLEREQRFEYDIDRILESVGARTKIIVFATPNNPTGNVAPSEGLEACAETGRAILIDEAYVDFSSAASFVPLLRRFPNMIVARTFSKSHALAGLRLGYLVADADVLDYVDRLLVPGSSASSVAFDAALAALSDHDFHRAHVSRVKRERGFLTDACRQLGCTVFESEGNFVLLAVPSRIGAADELSRQLLEQGILIRVISERFVRVSVGTRDENQRLVAAMTEMLG